MQQLSGQAPGFVADDAAPWPRPATPFRLGAADGTGPARGPVFVLCAGRSGSTLLRFLLDAHPELACPPETGLPGLCAQLAAVWSLMDGTPPPAGRDGEPPVTGAVAAKVRQTTDAMIGSHLGRRGKSRYCDKSLGTAQHTDLLLRLYPDATFICLYRHPMDVIASGLEACPWGLTGYGFEPYVASTPGNAVLALARYWADNAAAIAAVEQRHPDRCHRVRYEDLVSDPESTAAGIFAFLGVPPSPGISARCFAPERERLGPADYKIWHTSQITADSVGRGWSVPAAQITPAVTATVNELAGQLGYRPIDAGWSVTAVPPDMRVTADGDVPEQPAPAAGGVTREMPRVFIRLGQLLHSGLFRVSDRFVRRWPTCASESFVVVATSTADTGGSARWRVDLADRAVSLVSNGKASPEDPSGGVAWQLIGPAGVWEKVLRGQVNLNVALRRRELRFCATDQDGARTVARVGMLADLLGITSWRSPEAAGRSRSMPAA
jgi:Sulfotransferase family